MVKQFDVDEAYHNGYDEGYSKAKEDEVEKFIKNIKAGEEEENGFFFKNPKET